MKSFHTSTTANLIQTATTTVAAPTTRWHCRGHKCPTEMQHDYYHHAQSGLEQSFKDGYRYTKN
jgi:hypothetical protein